LLVSRGAGVPPRRADVSRGERTRGSETLPGVITSPGDVRTCVNGPVSGRVGAGTLGEGVIGAGVVGAGVVGAGNPNEVSTGVGPGVP
jgi:hypothetical protein